jgi:hypothetical protein
MNNDNNKSTRDKYEEDIEEIQDSDMSFTERRKSISELQDKHYDSQWGQLEDGLTEENKEKRYAIIIGAPIIFGLIGTIILQDLAGGFVFIGGLTFICFSIFMTKPGVQFLKNMEEDMGNNQQQQQKPSRSKPKRICSKCGWQNPESNNYCHDCGAELKKPNGTD